jgi:hypothetical protein
MTPSQKMESTQASKEKLEIITRKIVGKLLNNRDFQNSKSKILNLRKIYVKEKNGDINSEDEISRDFIDFLKKNLNVDVA